MQTAVARLFKNGQSQAVRIPKSMEFADVTEVEVSREGDMLILRPLRGSWLSFADLPTADSDFMQDRAELLDQARVNFDKE
jgi:antitoxin VapB